MTERHQEWQDLILSYEDLTDSEREKAGLHLQECAACRELLARVQGAEQSAGPRGELPMEETNQMAALSPAETREAEASLLALRQRLGLAGAPRHRPHRVLGRLSLPHLTWRILLPAAACAVALLLVARPWQGSAPRVEGLRILSAGQMRGAVEPVDTAKRWSTGEAFALQFRMTRRAVPVVVHIDPEGAAQILYPEDLNAPLTDYPGGTVLRLPPSDKQVEWTFEGASGSETFLIAAREKEKLDLRPLLRQLGAGAREHDRAAALQVWRRLLRKHVGAAQELEAVHLGQSSVTP